MAIRFDKDTRRATNGPMIFFSDPSAEISISDEIRGAIESRLSFYAYRMPGDMIMSFGSSEGVVEGIGQAGFVIAPFLPGNPYLTIPYKSPGKKQLLSANDLNESISPFPSHSTTKEEHENEITAIKKALLKTEGGKIVAARAILIQRRIDIGATFCELCRNHPEALVFCFSTPLTGCWIGASPELLLESASDGIKTMALAGTRKAGSQECWDIKNIEEQSMVTEYIKGIMQKHNLHTETSPTFNKIAGKVEHICTPLTAISRTPLTPDTLSAILHDLSPTPALCGTPREVALEIINENEHFKRGCYGGFCGPYRSPSDFTFYVNLRSALSEESAMSLFAGGGITLLSEPEAEWEETQIKSTTLLDSIHFEN